AVEQVPALAGAIESRQHGRPTLGEIELDPGPVLTEADQVPVVARAEGPPGEAEVDSLQKVRLPRPVGAVHDHDRRRQVGFRISEVAEPPALECADDHRTAPTR